MMLLTGPGYKNKLANWILNNLLLKFLKLSLVVNTDVHLSTKFNLDSAWLKPHDTM